MEIYLKPRNQAQFRQLLQDQQDQSSPKYHKWLTPAEYDEQFGPTAADVGQVTRWLTSEGFSVTLASAHEGRVAFEGNVAVAQAAFNVSIAASKDGKSFGNAEDPQLPASLAAKVSYLSGLDNLHGNLWNAVIDPPFNNTGLTNPFFGPNDFQAFNDETPLLKDGIDGSGQCIALSEGSDVDQASLGEFNTIFGLPAFVANTNFFGVYPDGQPSAPGIDAGGSPYAEAMLDVEYAHGVAPGATIVLYAADAGNSASDPSQALVDSAVAAVSDPNHSCAALAISWAQCGQPASFYTALDLDVFQKAAGEGLSIFVATGDAGTAEPVFNPRTFNCGPASTRGIEEIAGSPKVTAVGVSMFTAAYDTTTGNVTSTLAGTTQSAWKFSRVSKVKEFSFLTAAGASTGGYSKIFPRPVW